MASSRPRDQPLGLSLSGASARHPKDLAAPGARGMSGANAVAMLDGRPLAPRVGRVMVGSRIAGDHRAYQAHGPRCPQPPLRVINVLRHDLPKPAQRTNIPTVERETSHLRWAGRVRRTAPADACRLTALHASTTFIYCDRVPARAGNGGSVLHPGGICTNVLVNVYSGPGWSRCKGSGGVGIRHAGDASRY
jgi:hypothetical protein